MRLFGVLTTLANKVRVQIVLTLILLLASHHSVATEYIIDPPIVPDFLQPAYFKSSFRNIPECPYPYSDGAWGTNTTDYVTKNRLGNGQLAGSLTTTNCTVKKLFYDLTVWQPSLALNGTFDLSFVWHQPNEFYPGFKKMTVKVTYDGGQEANFDINLQNTTPSEFTSVGQYPNLETLEVIIERPDNYNIRRDGYFYLDGWKLTKVEEPVVDKPVNDKIALCDIQPPFPNTSNNMGYSVKNQETRPFLPSHKQYPAIVKQASLINDVDGDGIKDFYVQRLGRSQILFRNLDNTIKGSGSNTVLHRSGGLNNYASIDDTAIFIGIDDEKASRYLVPSDTYGPWLTRQFAEVKVKPNNTLGQIETINIISPSDPAFVGENGSFGGFGDSIIPIGDSTCDGYFNIFAITAIGREVNGKGGFYIIDYQNSQVVQKFWVSLSHAKSTTADQLIFLPGKRSPSGLPYGLYKGDFDFENDPVPYVNTWQDKVFLFSLDDNISSITQHRELTILPPSVHQGAYHKVHDIAALGFGSQIKVIGDADSDGNAEVLITQNVGFHSNLDLPNFSNAVGAFHFYEIDPEENAEHLGSIGNGVGGWVDTIPRDHRLWNVHPTIVDDVNGDGVDDLMLLEEYGKSLLLLHMNASDLTN